MGFPGGSHGKESACRGGDPNLIPGQEDTWRRKRQPTPVFLSGESHGWRSLAGFSPQDCTESDTAEHIELTIKMNVYNITAVTTVIALCGKIQEKKDCF